MAGLRRKAAALLLTALALVTVAPHTATGGQATYTVVGTGDSILGMTLGIASPGGAILEADRWIDAEYGRGPYVAGMQGRASTASIWPLVLARSQPGGWIIVQDNGHGTSDWGWRTLIEHIVDTTPNDRCLLFVLPVYHPDWSTTMHAAAANRALIMAGAATAQPCRATIPWHNTVLNDPTMVIDGEHPSARGRIWLNRAITNAITQ